MRSSGLQRNVARHRRGFYRRLSHDGTLSQGRSRVVSTATEFLGARCWVLHAPLPGPLPFGERGLRPRPSPLPGEGERAGSPPPSPATLFLSAPSSPPPRSP